MESFVTYFTADLHFYHENIIKFCNRPYANAEIMNVELLKNINETVGEHDELYILGDFGFAPSQKVKPILNQIVCKNLHYVYGNHDKCMKVPDIQRMFKTFSVYGDIAVEGQRIILFHFPLLEWDAGHRGSWMLHGHCHGTLVLPEMLKDKKIVDVGLDCWQYKPVSFDELKNYMKNKTNITYGDK